MLFTGINVNREWKKDDVVWNLMQVLMHAGLFGPTYAGNATASHAFARGAARTGRLVPGTAAFKSAFNKVTNEASVLKGSRLVDNSKIYHSDANYNLKTLLSLQKFK